mmetsp:Transcript_16509/g.51357  ORF Transcript_16509/g.51357 Transcript_16509/m.51357 type:complete len:202 (-) Transcript_16509:331-936(-)
MAALPRAARRHSAAPAPRSAVRTRPRWPRHLARRARLARWPHQRSRRRTSIKPGTGLPLGAAGHPARGGLARWRRLARMRVHTRWRARHRRRVACLRLRTMRMAPPLLPRRARARSARPDRLGVRLGRAAAPCSSANARAGAPRGAWARAVCARRPQCVSADGRAARRAGPASRRSAGSGRQRLGRAARTARAPRAPRGRS